MNAPLDALTLGARDVGLGAPACGRAGLLAGAERVAEAAAAWAMEVDRDARFPHEALAALRAARLLAAMLPAEWGGMDASVSDIVNVCYRLGQACASTAMIFAMHQASVACVLRHGRGQDWHAALLRRIGQEQLLLASSTTEGSGGGNIRSSAAAVLRDGDAITLERAASVMSYGAQADVILTTARRHADAAPSDQVLVAFPRDDLTLEPAGAWDTLGMRGTCSAGFHLHGRGMAEQILADPYEAIHAQSMVPVSQLAWCGAWAGIAADAMERARTFARMAARRANGVLPPGAAQFTQARASLQTLCALVASGARHWERCADDRAALQSFEFQAEMNLMKVRGSELALASVLESAQACGLAGYRNDGPHSVARALRDVLSARVMISDERMLGSVQGSLLVGDVAGVICQ